MDLDELERLLREATAGPWMGAGPSFGDPLPRYTTSMVTEWEDDDGFRTICEFGYAHHDDENEANAQLIAALRNSAEELIRDARRWRDLDLSGIVHDAVLRALDEAGVRNEVLRGMCLEVAIEKAQDAIAQEGKG